MKNKIIPIRNSFEFKKTMIRDRQKIRNLKGDDFDTSCLDSKIVRGNLSLFDWGWLNGLSDALSCKLENPRFFAKNYENPGYDEGYHDAWLSVKMKKI